MPMGLEIQVLFNFFSNTTLLHQLIGILLWVADAAAALEGANILRILEELLEKGQVLSDHAGH